MAGAKGASTKKAGQIDIPNSPWAPQGGPRIEIRPFPLVFPMYCASGRLFSDICLIPKRPVRMAGAACGRHGLWFGRSKVRKLLQIAFSR